MLKEIKTKLKKEVLLKKLDIEFSSKNKVEEEFIIVEDTREELPNFHRMATDTPIDEP